MQSTMYPVLSTLYTTIICRVLSIYPEYPFNVYNFQISYDKPTRYESQLFMKYASLHISIVMSSGRGVAWGD